MPKSIQESAAVQTIELHYENADGRVRIVPPDSDIMALSVETAIAACRAFTQQIVFKNQFDQLLMRLAEWIAQHKAKLSAACVTVRDSGLLFLVMLKEPRLDREIEESLTELDLEIANDADYGLISLAVHAIPRSDEATVQSFVSRKMALRYRIDGE